MVSWLVDPWDESLVPSWSPVHPDNAACVACAVSSNMTTKTWLILRGRCENSKFDRYYQGNVAEHCYTVANFGLILRSGVTLMRG